VLAHRWNLDTLKLEGEPVAVAEDVRSGGANGRNAFAISANGVLAYRAGGGGGNVQVTWYTHDGKAEGVVLEPGEYGEIELSPDDKHLVVVRGAGNDRDLWLKDLSSGVFSRLTSAAGAENDQVWSPDSRRVAYAGNPEGKRAFFETLIGSGKQTPIPEDGKQTLLEAWTPDGKQLLMRAGSLLSLLPAPQEGAAKPGEIKAQKIFEEKYGTDEFRISPDGKWVAYMSRESGQPEIDVAAFPAFTNRRQISIGGAVQPIWRADGKELFFLANDRKLMAVDVKAGATLETGPVRTLFQTNVAQSNQVHHYAVTRDGKRFLLREAVGSNTGAVEQLYLVTNWTSLVGR
jgi:Tol biopolymer transport system component